VGCTAYIVVLNKKFGAHLAHKRAPNGEKI